MRSLPARHFCSQHGSHDMADQNRYQLATCAGSIHPEAMSEGRKAPKAPRVRTTAAGGTSACAVGAPKFPQAWSCPPRENDGALLIRQLKPEAQQLPCLAGQRVLLGAFRFQFNVSTHSLFQLIHRRMSYTSSAWPQAGQPLQNSRAQGSVCQRTQGWLFLAKRRTEKSWPARARSSAQV